MDSIIRLRPGQNQSLVFNHELLDTANDYKLTDAELKEATWENQILANMWLVRRIVGRYLFHWPSTEYLTDDMVSAGLEGLADCVDLTEQNTVMNAIKNCIEQMLNDQRSMVRSSLMTNRRRMEEGKPLEYAAMEPLHPNVGDADVELGIIEHLDELDEDDLAFYQDEMTSDERIDYLKRRDA